jgi:phasin family protein
MAKEAGKISGDTPISKSTHQAMGSLEDFARLFSEMKWPSVPDIDALLAANKRNMETFSAAGRITTEAAQAVTKRQLEMVQQTVAEMSETMRALASSAESPQTRVAKQTDLTKHAYERTVADMQEISKLIERSNREAQELLNKRFAEAMDEMKAMLQKAGTHNP